ncbi:MAG TPA: hypothetical protein PK545_04260 [Deltaproteobacteria bacterium]|nr:hypothetical protein [Deltaproteobacteria bacterium]
MKTDKVEVNEYTHMAIVAFDDEKVTIEQIVTALENAGFPLGGPPKFLK